MSGEYLSDETIAAMSPEERRDLIERLERPLAEVIPENLLRLRAVRIGLMITGAVALIPWIVYLAITLPPNYVAHDWPATWVGFDLLLVAFMAATAVLGLLRRQLLILTAFTTGTLLLCDAWFDVMTSNPDDFLVAALTAVLAEIPLGLFMIRGSLLITRLTMTRLWLIGPGIPMWRVPILP